MCEENSDVVASSYVSEAPQNTDLTGKENATIVEGLQSMPKQTPASLEQGEHLHFVFQRLTGLEQIVESIIGQHENRRTDVDGEDGGIASLAQQIQSAIQRIERALQLQQQQVALTKSDYDAAIDENKQLQQRFVASTLRMTELEQMLQEVQNTKNDMEDKLNTQTKLSQSLADASKKLLDKTSKEQMTSDTTQTELQAQIQKLEFDFNAAVKSRDQLDSKVQTQKTQIAELEATLGENNKSHENEKDNWNQQLNDLKTRNKELDDQATQNQTQFVGMQQGESDMGERVADLSDKLRLESELNATLEAEVQTKTTEISKLQEQVLSLDENISELQQANDSLSSELQELTQVNSQLQLRVQINPSTDDEAVANLQTSLQQLEENCAHLQQRLSDKDSAIQSLSTGLENLERTLAAKDEEIATLTLELKAAKEALVQLGQTASLDKETVLKILELQHLLEQLNDTKTQLTSELSKERAANADLRRDLNAAREALAQEEKRAAKFRQRAEDLESLETDLKNLSQLKGQHEVATKEISSLKQVLKTQESVAQNAQAILQTQFDETQLELTNAIDQLKLENASLNEKLAAANQSIEQCQTNSQTDTPELESLKRDRESLLARLTQIEQQVANDNLVPTLQQEVQELVFRVQTSNITISELSQEISNLNVQRKHLTEEVESLKQELEKQKSVSQKPTDALPAVNTAQSTVDQQLMHSPSSPQTQQQQHLSQSQQSQPQLQSQSLLSQPQQHQQQQEAGQGYSALPQQSQSSFVPSVSKTKTTQEPEKPPQQPKEPQAKISQDAEDKKFRTSSPARKPQPAQDPQSPPSGPMKLARNSSTPAVRPKVVRSVKKTDGDDADSRIAAEIAKLDQEGYQGLSQQVIRIAPGMYKFGSKCMAVSVTGDQIRVRVGGGNISLAELLEKTWPFD
eukprot:c1413_g1_i1.p1 GENE.c1413_g1_i1~~c1413_g1_i1.p1  ORF type:complete len:1041 (+),score=282.97 c1413_g1_i1:362-3124(+)